MTATLPKIPDPLTVLTRAERKATGEEPGDLTHLADAVRTQIITPLTAGGTPVVDDTQVRQLLADKQRLGDLAEELRKQAETRGGVIDRQAHEIAELKHHVDEARAERDTARAQLRDQPAIADPAAAGQLEAENAELADQLAAARRDLAAANRTLDDIADEHTHRYPVAEPGAEPGPCDCGRPHPRSAAAYVVEDVEPSPPEPWADLLGRIRTEVAEAGWTA